MNQITQCEVCGNADLVTVLNLGENPLCDDLLPIGSDKTCQEYPIEIVFCNACKTAHQKFQPPKETIFPDTYHYRAHFTEDVLKGMENLVVACENNYGSLNGKTVLDIGCNDGSLLGIFRKHGARVIGVEPTGAAKDAKAQGIEVWQEYFTPETARKINAAYPKIDFITFTNVFAHIENLPELVTAVNGLSDDDTVVVIENHYLGSILEKNQFDTFYHEHPRSYSLTSFAVIAKQLHRHIQKVEFPSRYGGNIRVFLARQGTESSAVFQVLESEKHFLNDFQHMNACIARWKERKKEQILSAVGQHGKLSAKAFPGRAAILLKLLELDEKLIAAVYEKSGSQKIGNYVPGTRIPIRDEVEFFASTELQEHPVLNLAWHIHDEIEMYMRQHGYKGEIIDIASMEDFE